MQDGMRKMYKHVRFQEEYMAKETVIWYIANKFVSVGRKSGEYRHLHCHHHINYNINIQPHSAL
jgi:hypothetical protein